EHVAQEEDRPLLRSQRLEREEEREGHALEQVVATFRAVHTVDDRLVRGRRLGVAGVDRRRQPGTDVATPAPPPEMIAPEIRRDADEPGAERSVAELRRVLERADEGLLDDVLRGRGVARQAIAEPAQERGFAAVRLVEGGFRALRRGSRRSLLRAVRHAARAGLAAHAAAARVAARWPDAKEASASCPSRPTQSPAT